MSKTRITVPSNALSTLLSALRLSRSRKDLTALGVALATTIGRPKPYRYGHLHSVAGGQKPGRDLSLAIEAKLAETNGLPAELAASIEVTVFCAPTSDLAGAYIYGEAAVCPECLIKFHKDHPRRTKCKTCSPPRRRKA